MSKYSFNTKTIAQAHEIGPDLANYLRSKDHEMCNRCHRPKNDIEKPFEHMEGTYGDYGISKLIGCHDICSEPPTTWRFGSHASTTIYNKISCDTHGTFIGAIGSGCITMGEALKFGQFVEETQDADRLTYTVYNSDGTIYQKYIAIGSKPSIKIPGYNI